MPRIASRRKEYKAKDLGPWIAGQMRMKKITQADMASVLGISQPAVGKKLETGHFSYSDLIVVFNRLNTSDEDIIKLMRI